ncbi:NUDIX hydrolase [Pseudoxanthomonas mexicana]|uniref:NUDIX hydrolase n=1 Tax=Pseudoxanthomonas mexicana TaxID=128785 RepID=UPI00398A538C
MWTDPARASIVNERGERLVAVHAVGEAAVTAPFGFALALVMQGSCVLLVRNRRRKAWELPGGYVDAGESAAHCAVREVMEETGQRATNPRWRALMELEVPDRADRGFLVKHGALYRVEVSSVAPFDPTDEIEAIGWWPPGNPPDGTSAIDAALLAYAG